MTKRAGLLLLLGVNLVLLTTLIIVSGRPSAAYAQGAPLASNFVMVSGSILQSHDVLYMIDLANRDLHVFEMDRSTKRIFHRDARDLLRDFRGGR
jgi:hypothetical protein